MADAPLPHTLLAPPPRVLVVDDEEGPRRVLSQVVSRCGAKADLAASLAEARALLAQHHYPCALIDRNLGAESGLDLLRHLHAAHPDTDAIIITGYPNVDSAVEALRLGAVDYFSKPFEVAALVQRLRLLLERRALLDERHHVPALVHADRLATLGRVSAGVAHEINNPLTVVSGNLELALHFLGDVEAALPPAAHKRLRDVRGVLGDALKGADRIRQLVQELRTYARPPGAADTALDVHETLDAALRMAHYELRGRARLVRDFQADRPVAAEPGGLMHVFVNLLVNAAQAIEGPFEENEIHVSTRCVEGQVVAEVRDTGCGIAPEVRTRIFEPFFTTKPPGVGTGLGLCISQSIVSALGGTLSFDSQVGRGSTFRVQLPVSSAPRAEAGS